MEIPLKYNHRDCQQMKSQIHETLDVFMLVLSGESTTLHVMAPGRETIPLP